MVAALLPLPTRDALRAIESFRTYCPKVGAGANVHKLQGADKSWTVIGLLVRGGDDLFRHPTSLLSLLLAGCGAAERQPASGLGGGAGFVTHADRALSEWVRQRYEFQGEMPNFESGRIDLNGDGRPEVLVYVTGRNWCGTGGCNMAVLRDTEAGFEVVGDLTVVRPPIGVFHSTSNDWRDLAVWIGGGGMENPGMARVPFVQGKYVSNPTIEPAERSDEPFETVIERPRGG